MVKTRSTIKLIKDIAIFGGAEVEVETPLFKEVYEVARTLAYQGYQVIDGGGPGVMLAATQGAESVHGKTLAVTLDAKQAPGFEGKYLKNRTDVVIKTPSYTQRVHKLLEHADCYIVFNGGTGTISELGMVWCLARLYYPHHKPFILYGRFWHDVVAAFYRNMLMRDDDDKVFQIVSSVDQVIPTLEAFDRQAQDLIHHHNSHSEEKAFIR